jgi:hypothetical protein
MVMSSNTGGGVAVVTIAAVLIRKPLAEIGQQRLAAAAALVFGITDNGIQLLDSSHALVAFLLVDEILELGRVAVAVEQQAVRRKAVTPGAANFLIVAFNAFRQIVMHDKAHIRLVDAHAESDGRHHDLHIVADKGFLIAAAGLAVQPGVIGTRCVSQPLSLSTWRREKQ